MDSIFPANVPSNAPINLFTRFKSAIKTGNQVLQDPSKLFLRNQFLTQAHSALFSLYGANVSITKKYLNAKNNNRKITTEEIVGFITEFGHILNWLEYVSGQENINPISHASAPPSGKKVFIIHGHDELNTLRLKNLLNDQFKIDPILMMEEPGIGRALLEKFEDVASVCSMAFAIVTPDDQILNDKGNYYQTRPNVIYEAGWFVGRLGSSRVCLLLKDGVNIHSDIDGISRIHFRDNVDEKAIDIQKELKASGLI